MAYRAALFANQRCDGLIVQALGAVKNNASTEGQPLRRLATPPPRSEFGLVRIAQHNLRRRSASGHIHLAPTNTWYVSRKRSINQ